MLETVILSIKILYSGSKFAVLQIFSPFKFSFKLSLHFFFLFKLLKFYFIMEVERDKEETEYNTVTHSPFYF